MSFYCVHENDLDVSVLLLLQCRKGTGKDPSPRFDLALTDSLDEVLCRTRVALFPVVVIFSCRRAFDPSIFPGRVRGLKSSIDLFPPST